MLIILGIVYEFQDFEGKYVAFFQNLMMSGLFIALLLQRGNLAGQSMGIAVCKMVGTLFAAVGFYLYFRTPLITIISVATLFYDWLYILLIYRLQRKQLGYFVRQLITESISNVCQLQTYCNLMTIPMGKNSERKGFNQTYGELVIQL